VQAPPRAPRHFDDTDNVMRLLAYKKISAYSGVGHGFYFWNFRTDLDEPDWSYLLALERDGFRRVLSMTLKSKMPAKVKMIWRINAT